MITLTERLYNGPCDLPEAWRGQPGAEYLRRELKETRRRLPAAFVLQASAAFTNPRPEPGAWTIATLANLRPPATIFAVEGEWDTPDEWAGTTAPPAQGSVTLFTVTERNPYQSNPDILHDLHARVRLRARQARSREVPWSDAQMPCGFCTRHLVANLFGGFTPSAEAQPLARAGRWVLEGIQFLYRRWYPAGFVPVALTSLVLDTYGRPFLDPLIMPYGLPLATPPFHWIAPERAFAVTPEEAPARIGEQIPILRDWLMPVYLALAFCNWPGINLVPPAAWPAGGPTNVGEVRILDPHTTTPAVLDAFWRHAQQDDERASPETPRRVG